MLTLKFVELVPKLQIKLPNLAIQKPRPCGIVENKEEYREELFIFRILMNIGSIVKQFFLRVLLCKTF